MLKFRNTVVLYAVILILVIAIDIFTQVSGFIYAGIIIAFISVLAWGAKNIQSNFYLESFIHGDRSRKQVALTFDDGPDEQVTPEILDVLKKHNVKAAFFVIGNKAEKNPEIIRRIDNEGHLIGSHSYSHHFFFDLFSGRRMEEEISATEKIIHSVTGKRTKLFRPPYGVTNPTLARAIKNQHVQSTGWSLKSNDTVIKDEARLLENLLSKVKDGDIILFHDNKPWNVRTLDNFLTFMNEKKYSILRLDEFLAIDAYVH